MPTASGVIQSVRKDRKGFKIDEVWYSGYTPDELNGASKGDTVTLEYTEKGQYKNIVKGTVQVTASAPAGGGGSGYTKGGGDKQFRSVPELNRIDALRLAVDTVPQGNDLKAQVQHIIKLAKAYVAFIEGAGGGTAQAGTAPQTDAAAEAEAAAARAKAEAEAKAKAEAEAKAKAEAEAKARAEAQAAQAQNSAAALDAFLDD